MLTYADAQPECAHRHLLQHPRLACLYFCTSKASKLCSKEAQVLSVNCYSIRGERRCATADACGRMRAYADVCSRVLMCADVC